MLQYNHLEVVNELEHELRENPLLEVASFDEPFPDGDARPDLTSLEDAIKEPERPRNDIAEVDWDNYLESYGADYSPPQRDFSEHPQLENMASYQERLLDYLFRQLQLSDIEGYDRRIAVEIIGNIDESGYLDIELDELARTLDVPVEDVESILLRVQEFDPRGIAARNLQECLLLQARALDPRDPLVIEIIEEGFDLLEKEKYEALIKKLKITYEELKPALAIIGKFDPRPAKPFTSTDTVYVAPDIHIIKVGSDYQIMVNDEGLPRLKISSLYKKDVHTAGAAGLTKDYIQEKTRGALWLIKSIHQRQRTIYKVTESIVKFQREFFDKGIDYLKPLILKDVADDVEMHESTISRVTTNKYVQTPRGIFELKFFFNAGIRQGSDSIAAEAVRNQIFRIVKNENPKSPASDKEIVEALARYDIHIARRTVAKYREQLGISQSSKRRKRF